MQLYHLPSFISLSVQIESVTTLQRKCQIIQEVWKTAIIFSSAPVPLLTLHYYLCPCVFISPSLYRSKNICFHYKIIRVKDRHHIYYTAAFIFLLHFYHTFLRTTWKWNSMLTKSDCMPLHVEKLNDDLYNNWPQNGHVTIRANTSAIRSVFLSQEKLSVALIQDANEGKFLSDWLQGGVALNAVLNTFLLSLSCCVLIRPRGSMIFALVVSWRTSWQLPLIRDRVV